MSDWVSEEPEQFFVDILAPSGDRLVGVATVLDNPQNIPTVTITDETVVKGESAHFTVHVSQGYPPRNEELTIEYNTFDWSADDGWYSAGYGEQYSQALADYDRSTGSLTFEPGEFEKTIVVPTKEDWRKERSEDFFVELLTPWNDRTVGRGTIDDDPGAIPLALFTTFGSLSPGVGAFDVSVAEGDSVELVIYLNQELPDPVDIQYWTRPGSASGCETYSCVDYEHVADTVTLDAGETWTTIELETLSDWSREQEEQFYVELLTPWGQRDVATIAIEDEDLPIISVSDETVEGGDSAVFTVQLSHSIDRDVSLYYETSSGWTQNSNAIETLKMGV